MQGLCPEAACCRGARLFGLSIIVFLVMALIPGDTATAILGSYATPENVERINRDLGLDKPLVQAIRDLDRQRAAGRLRPVLRAEPPVLDEVLERFQATLVLAGVSLVLCSVIGLFAGVVSAVRQFGWADRIHHLLRTGRHLHAVLLARALAHYLFAVHWRILAGLRHVRRLRRG